MRLVSKATVAHESPKREPQGDGGWQPVVIVMGLWAGEAAAEHVVAVTVPR